MKTYESTDVRNVALVGHGNSGKTSLAAAMLYTAGATNRLTRVDEGNTITDYDDEEIARKITISTALAAVEWNRKKLNLFDTPGFSLFTYDTKIAMGAADSALILVDGVAGVEVVTEKVWEYAEGFNLPRAFFVNKLDRERADFQRTVDNIVENFGRHAIPVQLPIGAERDFRGIVDLIEMKAYSYTPEGDGKGREIPIPDEMKEEAEKAHAALVEMIAEGKDELMERFFEQGTLPPEDILAGLHEAVKADRIFPILCGSSLLNIGADLAMNFMLMFCPNPAEHPAIRAMVGDHEEFKAITDKDHVTAYVFKTVADPFAGRLSFFKVCTGVLKNDANLVCVRSKSQERLAHLSVPFGKQLIPVNELHAGDIGVVAKLKDVLTGDTLCEKGDSVEYPKVEIPEPSIAYAIAAKSRNDEDRMGNAVARILEEDPGLRFYRDPQTNEFLLAGMGGQHVEIIVSRLKRRYNVEVELRAPKIPYRETIRGFADVHGRHKKQTGGHGQFGDCKIKMEPLERGKGFEFVNSIFGGAIPKQFIPAVEKGVREAMEEGVLAGYPVVNVKVTLVDGSYHSVDSSEMSFKIAAAQAFKKGALQAKPILLEPVMRLRVTVPDQFTGDVMSDLNGKRAQVQGMTPAGNGTTTIEALVPAAELQRYATELRSLTQGRGTFTVEFSHYQPVPQHLAEQVIAETKARQAAAS